ncbi:MAG: amidohydrolase, partial [Chloroflexi bacterium]|nr:amidohydrolase [Chloroflexota bacterium]
MEPLTLINARVLTMDPGHPFASGLVIQDGKISHLISDRDKDQYLVQGETLDLDGQILMPGLIDSHLHLWKYAETLEKIDCETKTKEVCLSRVRERVLTTPPGEWILGHGWNHNIWMDGFGNAGDLDQITTNHPVYLTGKSLHVSWANSRALALAGIQADSPDPPHGSLQRDGAGNLTGILLEDAVKLIESILPKPSTEKIARSIQNAQKYLWQMGLTGVHDFDREACIIALQSLDKNQELKLRVCKSIPSSFYTEAIDLGYRTGEGSDWLWFGGVKEFMDGALGPQTAAMLNPYQGSDGIGMLINTEEDIFELGYQAARGGLALSIHAIGDLANRALLNALERLRKAEQELAIPPLPHRIEHVQLIDPADLPRLASLGVIASMQPIHATSDMEMADAYWGSRTAYAYAPKHLMKQGALVIFGSDAPVENPNPWWGIHAAVTRRRADGTPGPDGWHPEGRVTLTQALEAFTVNPARAVGK